MAHYNQRDFSRFFNERKLKRRNIFSIHPSPSSNLLFVMNDDDTQLMELAGLSVAQAICKIYPRSTHPRVLVVAGKKKKNSFAKVFFFFFFFFGFELCVLSDSFLSFLSFHWLSFLIRSRKQWW
jgi:hypothetical protein